ncbi:MAG TPA: hypothetical protein VLH79_10550 [Chthonomonadales bacterium]|nr:hypothetical protein [Chthonomonadales bacterium]
MKKQVPAGVAVAVIVLVVLVIGIIVWRSGQRPAPTAAGPPGMHTGSGPLGAAMPSGMPSGPGAQGGMPSGPGAGQTGGMTDSSDPAAGQ